MHQFHYHINDSMEDKENAKAPLQTKAAEDLVKRVMAATENKCVVAPPPKKELTEIEKLTAMVADMQTKLSKSGGSGERTKRAEFYDPVPGWKFYCSTHGVNSTHENGQCKKPGKYHKEGATFADKKGGCKRNMKKWEHATKGERIDYSN